MAEYFPIDVNFKSYSGSFSGSFFGNGSGITGISASNAISASYATTASFLLGSVVSASYALTASFALNGGGGTAFPYTGSAVITGSLIVTGSTTSTLGFTGSLLGTASYATNGGVTQLLAGPNISLSPTTGVGQVTISSTAGGGGFNTATGSYGSFYDTTTQTNVAGTARSMSLNTTDITNGVSVSGSTNPFNTYIKVENAGVYNIQFSAQVDKTDSGTDEIWIWIRKNGTNLTDTATSVLLQGNGAHYVAAWNFFVNAAAGDYFQLMWYSPDANVRLHAEPAFGVVPGIPSLIVTANRVDQFLSNTGSFSGSFNGIFTGSLFGTASFAATASYVNPLRQDVIITGSLSVGSGSRTLTTSMNTGSNTFILNSSVNLGLAAGLTAGIAFTVNNGATAMYITSASQVLIGNPRVNPIESGSATLHVTNVGTQNSFLVEDSANPDTTPFVINNAGSVGIGTITPSVPLEVVGNTIISGSQIIRHSFGTTYYDSSGYGGGRIFGSFNYLNGEIYIQPSSSVTQAFIFSPNNGMSIGGFTIGGTTGSPPAYGLAVSGSIGIGTRTPITQLDVSGSGRFTSNLTVTGSVIATSLTGSLLGTASYATQALSASWAPGGGAAFPYVGTAVITGSLIVSGANGGIDTSLNNPVLLAGDGNAAVVFGTNRKWLNNASGVTTVDWEVQSLNDSLANPSIDWNSRILYDTSAAPSVDWENRTLSEGTGTYVALEYSSDTYVNSQLYYRNIIPAQVQRAVADTPLSKYGGQAIQATVDVGVTDFQLVYLDTDGTWKVLKNLPTVSTKMVGINIDGAYVMIEGDIGVSDDNSQGAYVIGADHGLPVYISGTNGVMTTTVPTSGVVRILGHVYYNSSNDINWWTMKFRPSNDWYEI